MILKRSALSGNVTCPWAPVTNVTFPLQSLRNILSKRFQRTFPLRALRECNRGLQGIAESLSSLDPASTTENKPRITILSTTSRPSHSRFTTIQAAANRSLTSLTTPPRAHFPRPLCLTQRGHAHRRPPATPAALQPRPRASCGRSHKNVRAFGHTAAGRPPLPACTPSVGMFEPVPHSPSPIPLQPPSPPCAGTSMPLSPDDASFPSLVSASVDMESLIDLDLDNDDPLLTLRTFTETLPPEDEPQCKRE